MSRLQLLLRSFLSFVEAIEPGIAVFAAEWIQTDDSQQRLPPNPVRAPYGVTASTFWAIWHHIGSHSFVGIATRKRRDSLENTRMSRTTNQFPPVLLNESFTFP